MEALVPIVFFLCVAGVLILRPISTKLGKLLEQMSRDRQSGGGGDAAELTRVRVVMEHLSRRLELLEERLDFTERLIGNTRRAQLAASQHHDPLHIEREAGFGL